MKLIPEEYLTEYKEKEEKRRANLKSERRCLKIADPESSIYLVEYFKYEDNAVIITDLVSGCDLWDLR